MRLTVEIQKNSLTDFLVAGVYVLVRAPLSSFGAKRSAGKNSWIGFSFKWLRI